MENESDTDNAVEPYGAQLLRKAHKDHTQMMADYDGLSGPLEHDDVKSHLQGHLEGIEKFLSNTEKLFGKHYKDLPGLEGMDEEGKEVGEQGEKNLKVKTKGVYKSGKVIQIPENSPQAHPHQFGEWFIRVGDMFYGSNGGMNSGGPPQHGWDTENQARAYYLSEWGEESEKSKVGFLKKSFTQQKESLEKLTKKLNELASKV